MATEQTEPYESTCRHCGARIVRTQFLGRNCWVHQPAGSAFQDNQHWHCKITSAEPVPIAGPGNPSV